MTTHNPANESDLHRLKNRSAAFDAVGVAEQHVRDAHAEGCDPMTRLDLARRAFDALGTAQALVRGDTDVTAGMIGNEVPR